MKNDNVNRITQKGVSIIVLNYNNWEDTITCLESVFNMDYQNLCVIVIDNGSKDNSVGQIRKWASGELKCDKLFPNHPYFEKLDEVKKPLELYEYVRKENFKERYQAYDLYNEIFIPKSNEFQPKQAKLIIIETKQNLGYAGGNNVGIRFALNYLDVDYIMILNNDTVVASDLVKNLLAVFTLEEKAGICGPIEYSYQEPYNIKSTGGQFGLYTGKHKLLKKSVQGIKAVDWLIGSCMLIKRELFHKIGYFDERYFLYVDEVDYAYRARAGGYKVLMTSGSCFWHRGGTIGGKTFDELHDFYIMRNRLLFSLKHLNNYQLLIFIPIHMKKLLTFSLRDLILKKQSNFIKRFNAIKEAFAVHSEKIKKYNTAVNADFR